MALDVVVEGENEFEAGSTDVGARMDGPPKPAPTATPPTPPATGEFKTPLGQHTPGAAPVNAGAWPTTSEGAQRVLDKAMGDPEFRKVYLDASHPAHKEAVDGVTALHRLASPEPESEQPSNPIDDLPDLRRFAGVPHPDLGGVRYDEADEVNFLRYVIDENISPQTAQGMTEWYATRFVAAAGQPLTQADKDEFRATFASRSANQISTLIRWYDEEIVPKLRKAQRG